MKKTAIIIMSALMLLTACSAKTGNTKNSAKDSGSISSESTSETNIGTETAKQDTDSRSYTVTDITGRNITFEAVPEKALSLGHGALIYYVYICGSDSLIGVEEASKSGHTLTGQSIHYAYPKLRELETMGKGGAKFEPDYERITYTSPDVVFMAYENTAEELDEIQEKLQIPVVGISAGMNGQIFGEDVYKTFEIIGKTMNKEERADELITYMKSARQDLETRIAMSKENSENVYLGGCSYRGAQGILSTRSHTQLLEVSGAKNIMDALTDERSLIIDKEKLIDMEPEIILLDLSGKELIFEDMKADPDFYNSLTAFKNHKVYALMPYFTYGMNYDTAILDVYYIGKLLHPEEFKDIDIDTKAKEIYSEFVGSNTYDGLKAEYPESFNEVSVQ